MKNIIATTVLLFAQAAFSQAPASAPAGATGICKDGTFSTAAVKDGACRGHKGVQTWYKAAVPSLPAPTPGTTASIPAPTPKAVDKSLPAPTPTSSPSLPVPAHASATPSRPVPTPATITPSQPVPTPGAAPASMLAPAAPVNGGPRAHLATMQAAPGGGPGLVWVNSASKVYHCPGSDFYGKTKAGAYMTEAAAKAEGDRPNRNKPCS